MAFLLQNQSSYLADVIKWLVAGIFLLDEVH
jgi:hypothetical protein